MSAAAPRREILLGLAGPAIAATVPGAALHRVGAYTNGDAELRAAWAAFLEMWRTFRADDDDTLDQLNSVYTQHTHRVWDPPAVTLEGVLIKMRMMCIHASTCVAIVDHYALGEPAPDDPEWDRSDNEFEYLLWDNLRETEALIASEKA